MALSIEKNRDQIRGLVLEQLRIFHRDLAVQDSHTGADLTPEHETEPPDGAATLDAPVDDRLGKLIHA